MTLWSTSLLLACGVHASPGHLQPDGQLAQQLYELTDVIVESTLEQSTAVFGGGQATAMWALKNPGVSLAPEDNVAVFTVHSSQGIAEGMRSLSLLSPKVHVSDAKVLDVIISKEVQPGPTPLILIARHVCKQRGSSQVTITLPPGKPSSAGLPRQVGFSYLKVCKFREGAMGLSLLRMQALSRWDVPTYGWRILIAAVAVFVLGVAIHEFGHHYVSKQMEQQLKDMGPSMFGTEIEIGQLQFRPWTGVFRLCDFKIKNPPGYTESEYLLRADEVSMLIAPKRILYTFGRTLDINLLRLTGVHCDVSFRPFSMENNLAVVQKHLIDSQENDAQALAGQQPGYFAAMIDKKANNLLDHARLHKAEFLDVSVSTKGMLGEVQLQISDMHFEDFSQENNAVGLRQICSKLTDVFYETIKNDALGETGAKVLGFSETHSVNPSSPSKGRTGAGFPMNSMEDDAIDDAGFSA